MKNRENRGAYCGQKEVWVDCTEDDLEEKAIEYGATGIIGKGKKGLKSLAGELVEVSISTREDVKKLRPYLNRSPYVVVNFPDWKVIPAENVVAELSGSSTKALVRTNDLEEARVFGTALELGVSGFIVSDPDKIEIFCSEYKPRPELQLVDAEVIEVRKLGPGMRACLDLITEQYEREGLLVGSYSDFLFLADSETKDTEESPSRPFRVNAGAGASYTLLKPGKTQYLGKLRAMDMVLLVGYEGKTRKSFVARNKMEERPMLGIMAKYGNRCGVVISQYAETVRLVTPDDSIPVTKIKPGYLVKAYVVDSGGMHFGKAVEGMRTVEK
jgi:3-dehydroquinate synthase II